MKCGWIGGSGEMRSVGAKLPILVEISVVGRNRCLPKLPPESSGDVQLQQSHPRRAGSTVRERGERAKVVIDGEMGTRTIVASKGESGVRTKEPHSVRGRLQW